jgi:hypothetical protein
MPLWQGNPQKHDIFKSCSYFICKETICQVIKKNGFYAPVGQNKDLL